MPSLSAPSRGIVRERVLRKTPWESQRKFHGLKSRFKGFSGPVGSGKSLALVYEAVRLSVVNRGRMGLIGAPTYPMLRDVTERAFFDELDAAEIPYRFNKQEHHMRLLELGSEIVFRSLDHVERLRGTNLAWFGIDEMTYTTEGAFERLQARLRDPQAKELCGFGVWTPNGFDWVYQRFIRNSTPDYQAVIAKPRENRTLPQDFYDQLARSYDERFYRQEALGEYLNIAAGRAYYAFDRNVNVMPVDYDPFYPISWSLDFNVDPMCSVIAQVVDASSEQERLRGIQRKRINVLDELYLRDSNTPAACEAFYSLCRPLIDRHGSIAVHIYGDASGSARQTASAGAKSDWDAVREFLKLHPEVRGQTFIRRANPLVRDRVAAVNGAMRNQVGEKSCFVSPRCVRLIKDLEQVTWKDGGAELDKTRDSDLTHISDALGYLIERELGRQGTGYRSGPSPVM